MVGRSPDSSQNAALETRLEFAPSGFFRFCFMASACLQFGSKRHDLLESRPHKPSGSFALCGRENEAPADKKCRTVVPNRSAEGQRTEVNLRFSNG